MDYEKLTEKLKGVPLYNGSDITDYLERVNLELRSQRDAVRREIEPLEAKLKLLNEALLLVHYISEPLPPQIAISGMYLPVNLTYDGSHATSNNIDVAKERGIEQPEFTYSNTEAITLEAVPTITVGEDGKFAITGNYVYGWTTPVEPLDKVSLSPSVVTGLIPGGCTCHYCQEKTTPSLPEGLVIQYGEGVPVEDKQTLKELGWSSDCE